MICVKEIVEYIVKSLVESPDDAVITSEEEDNNVKILVNVASEDMGRIIGKQGRIARAIRVIAQTAAARRGKKCYIEIRE